MKIRSGCDGGGKGPLVQEELSATLATHQDQTLFELRNTVLNDQGGGSAGYQRKGMERYSF